MPPRFPEPAKEFTIRRGGLGLDGEKEGPLGHPRTRTSADGLADRLREVRALTGFRRHSRTAPLVPADTSGRLRWLPATEVYGEGIVLTLDEQRLTAWRTIPASRPTSAASAPTWRPRSARNSSPGRGRRTVATLPAPAHVAHLLIRQLSLPRFRVHHRQPARARSTAVPSTASTNLLVYTAAGGRRGHPRWPRPAGRGTALRRDADRMLEAAAWLLRRPAVRRTHRPGLRQPQPGRLPRLHPAARDELRDRQHTPRPGPGRRLGPRPRLLHRRPHREPRVRRRHRSGMTSMATANTPAPPRPHPGPARLPGPLCR
ncbi:hypothetical protein LV779_14540 [Streptomyces thinghirensis]|nr:hypothetical protein [Streptomyces thinghirensis]